MLGRCSSLWFGSPANEPAVRGAHTLGCRCGRVDGASRRWPRDVPDAGLLQGDFSVDESCWCRSALGCSSSLQVCSSPVCRSVLSRVHPCLCHVSQLSRWKPTASCSPLPPAEGWMSSKPTQNDIVPFPIWKEPG